MPRFIIHHVTKYTYAEFVRDSANQIMLFPLKDEYQEVQQQKLSITHEPAIEVYKDYYGNEIGSFMNIAPHTELRIDSTISVVTKPRVFPKDADPVEAQWNHLQEIRYMVPFIDFLKQENFARLDEVKKIADDGFYKTVTVFTAVKQLTEYVYKNFNYIKGITTVETTLDEIWSLKAGVCQDFAHILLVMLRLLNIPARYVSGYIETIPPKGKAKLQGSDASHAWISVYIPEMGWCEFDPTNNMIPQQRHIVTAYGRDFADVSPLKGIIFSSGDHKVKVEVDVIPLS